ncbi:aminoacyl-tRNA hydrolase [Candidatus Saccharibacteria bacterium]|nr:aminoacyl-tRNA hydrolase [Candidatus Saccharibacteria bacterium]
MKLIIGLGNPGAEYTGTRHNFGWRALDFLAEKFDAGKWKNEKKFHAMVAKANLDREDILLIKPQTFYNLSGQSVRAIRDFYKLDNSDILVIHDDMDLQVGRLRAREKGSAAGNNGVQSLINHIGTDFARLRIGSGKDAEHDGLTKPSDNHSDYVLSRPNSAEKAKFEQLLPEIEQATKDFIAGEFTAHSVKV